MDDLVEQLARRDRYRRELAKRMTPGERMAAFEALEEHAWEVLRSNPAGYAWFMRRNFKARAIRVKDWDAK